MPIRRAARASHHKLTILLIVALAIAILCPIPTATASQYYFSALGNDLTGNGSLAKPWRSVGQFNKLDLNPGDNVFFHAGDTFDGRLALASTDTGTNAQGQLIAPISIGSYGGAAGARAIIRSPVNTEGLLAIDNGGIELRDLEFASGGTLGTTGASGIKFLVDKVANNSLARYQHIVVENVVAHGFKQNGLFINASNTAGYDGVTIRGGEFYDNQNAGVVVAGDHWMNLTHKNVLVDSVTARNNTGYANCPINCGHGVVIAQVDGGVIQNSAAYANGLVAGMGNVGIWTHQSNNITIQRNLAYGNRSPKGMDGGGFDFDGGVTNSVMQYNTSRDNDGAGYLLAQFAGAEAMGQNVVRYNLSMNDGRGGYGGITIWGATANDLARSTVFHNNTIVVDKNAAPLSKGALWFYGSSHTDIDMFNNVFEALNGATLIEGATTNLKSTILNNVYWTDERPLKMYGISWNTLAQWAAWAHQERLDGQLLGREVDPKFLTDGTYRLAAGSALIDAALTVGNKSWPNWLTSIGNQDLYGVSLVQGAGAEIGAAEYGRMRGDFNDDGIVDAADYLAWRAQYGRTVLAGSRADGSGDGYVDAADFIVWRDSMVQTLALGGTLVVPEPGPTALVVAMSVSLSVFRRRRRAA